MALSNVEIILYGISFLIFFAVIAQVFASISGTSLFNLLEGILKSDQKKTFKQKKIPDDRQFILSYPSKNFKQRINGRIISGKDLTTGKEMLRFNYGEDQTTDFSIPNDPSRFRIAEPSKLDDISKLVIEIVDDDTYTRLRNKLDNATIQAKSLEQQLQDRMKSQTTQLQKTVEVIREEKKVAFGWTGNAQQTSGMPYRPWSPFNRYQGMGGGMNEEEQI